MKVRLEIVHTFEMEVDDRFHDAGDLQRIAERAHDMSDGRQPFFFEVSLHGAEEVARTVAHAIQGALVWQFAEKYPGAMAVARARGTHALSHLFKVPEPQRVWEDEAPPIRLVKVDDKPVDF